MSPSAQNLQATVSHAGTEVVPAWKQELNERLAATRSRRLRNMPEQVALPGLEQVSHKADSRAARLAARVAQRYANAPSYSELLAAEARARSQAAALSRKASETTLAAAQKVAEPATGPEQPRSLDCEDLTTLAAASVEQQEVPADLYEEPEEEMIVEPLAVNLIEFPRELVAARRMRPRLEEGPLCDADGSEPHDRAQRRIFELQPESVSRSVSIGPPPANWAPILLDDDLVASPATRQTQSTPLKTARIEDRVMATIFDMALIAAAFAVFVLVFVACTAHPPTGKPALLAAGLLLTGFAVLYHFLFFRYAEGTPGMRYAKIALCTFEDENPTRQAMCRRVLFLLLSAAPLGMGFLWACFDQDRLGWHDRISRMYQRSYS